MQTQLSGKALILSIVVCILATIVSAGGLIIKNLYSDNAFVKSAWHSNDVITLFIVVPLLATTTYLSQNGSERWLMVWRGLMGYVFYNFAFYLFGAAFNIFFILYAALFSLSAITIILQLSNVDTSNTSLKFNEKTPVKWVSIYLIIISAMLFILEISMIIPFLLSGIIPDTIKLTGHHTSEIFALDFSIVIPVSIIAAILLWQRRSWGFILSIMMLVKGFTYGLVLCLGTILLAFSDVYGQWDSLMPLYIILTVGGIVGCWLLLRNFKETNTLNNV